MGFLKLIYLKYSKIENQGLKPDSVSLSLQKIWEISHILTYYNMIIPIYYNQPDHKFVPIYYNLITDFLS